MVLLPEHRAKIIHVDVDDFYALAGIARLNSAGLGSVSSNYVLGWYQLGRLGWPERTASRAALDALASRTEHGPLISVRVASP